jgi:hypothetical protein
MAKTYSRNQLNQALDDKVTFVEMQTNRIVDERGGRSAMGVPMGRALAEKYETEHDDEREYGGDGDTGHGYVPFPE